MLYFENDQYLVGVFNGGKRHPISWKIGYWRNEYTDGEENIAAGFRRLKSFRYPWQKATFIFDLTKNKDHLLSMMGNDRCKPNTLYLIWRLPYGHEINAHFKICKTNYAGWLKNGDSARWIELRDLIEKLVTGEFDGHFL